MPNQFTGKAPFAIVYSKPLNHTIDLLHLRSPTNKDAETFANRISSTFAEVHSQLAKSIEQYNIAIDLNHHHAFFKKGSLFWFICERHSFLVANFISCSLVNLARTV